MSNTNSYLIADIDNGILKITNNFFTKNNIKEVSQTGANQYFIGLYIDTKTNETELCLVRRNFNKAFFREVAVPIFDITKNNHTYKNYTGSLYWLRGNYDVFSRNQSEIYNIMFSLCKALGIENPFDYVENDHRIEHKVRSLLFRIIPSNDENIFLLKSNKYKVPKEVTNLYVLQNRTRYFTKHEIIGNNIYVDRFLVFNIDGHNFGNYHSRLVKPKEIFNYEFYNSIKTHINTYLNVNNFQLSYSIKTLSSIKYKHLIYLRTTNKFYIGDFNKYKKVILEYFKLRRSLNPDAYTDPTIGQIFNDTYQELAFSKVLGSFTTMTSSQIEEFSARLDAINKKTPIEIVSGEDIVKYYLVDNYLFPGVGDLGGSCMRYSANSEHIKFFANNPDSVCMAVQKVNDKILSRALIWKDTDGNKIMDRIYFSYPNQILEYHQYCEENNIINIYKHRIPAGSTADYTKMGITNWKKEWNKYFKIPITNFPFEVNDKNFHDVLENTSDPRRMPYMDNFKYINLKDFYLTNEKISTKVFCISRQKEILIELATQIHTGEWAHRDDIVQCYMQNDMIDIKKNCVYSNYYNCYISTVDSIVFSNRVSSEILLKQAVYLEELRDHIPSDMEDEVKEELRLREETKKLKEMIDEDVITLTNEEEEEDEIAF